MGIAGVSAIFVLWCVVHSATATDAAKCVAARWGLTGRWYRLLYNGVSVLTLLPVAAAILTVRGTLRYWLPFPLSIIQALVVLGAAAFAMAAFRNYDGAAFVGLRDESPGLCAEGIQSLCRHPLYLSSLILFWMRWHEPVDWAINGIATLYFLVGIYLEERRLVARYGETYATYRQQVPMLIPSLRRRPRARGCARP